MYGAIFLEAKSSPLSTGVLKSSQLINQCEQQNNSFHQIHAKFSRLHLLNIDHVIIYLHGHLLHLQRKNDGYIKMASAPTAAASQNYHQIKYFTHLSVSLTILIEVVISGKIALNDVSFDLDALDIELDEARCVHATYQSHQSLIDFSSSLISQLRSCNNLSKMPLILKQYLKDTQPLNEAYAKQATVLQLSSLDKIMTEWISTQKINLEKSRIIIVGPDGPREGLIEKQYFDKLYNDVINNKTEYVTMLPKQMHSLTPEDLIEELGKRELNRAIGKSMLHDENAMSKDVLAPYAPPALSTLFAKKSGICPMKLSKS